ncbi:Fibropellin-1,Neurogenic locus notch homolog protein 2,Neurogenic locus notch homolog protein 1,Fibropellin-3,Sushi, von Willebrand factor type A, EGF and pentraxin domain-containing protein 1,Neurogenic locus notch homolog protein 3,Protein eyes shut homolog,Neurogenic locus Notch protein [Mytilus edulis]|uniref:EGF-like domain-containing protein n=1 Tax=Mytilus edulis TaxID=6550 RepID=A0A8S3VE59_MYTED|nr:Fibropellin-1,Neurogenic locus notch homolog protein 2,Neurogenic locus notch homolog protein 1,Fibropellin-3,Sushi, von Willebrand factor type A, EGF and pentraxin domain-containing protein 1,Neurogenic locus notch homolog protein 3,Protein eyes shut homolog,Neurogenic locus Notch protein [Mytilus edulis]
MNIAVVFLVQLNLLVVYGSHFRGGTVRWKYMGDGNKVEFKYSLSWAHGQGSAPSWQVVNLKDSSTLTIGSGNYSVVANNSAENWERGEATFIYDFPSKGPYRVSFTGGDWISLGYGNGGSWNIQTIVDLNNRSDTHNPNYSPSTFSRAIYRVQYGCKVRIQIPVIDVDGDTVRCRWSTSTEAASISKLLPNAVLNEKKCMIEFSALPGSSYALNSWYAVALTMEDFPRTTINIDGKVIYFQNTPITSVPLQFLLRVEASTSPCHEKPVFVSPTPSEGILMVLKATQTLNVTFIFIQITDIDPCDNSSCQHESTCKRVGYTSDFICTCVPGFTGKLCETDIDECYSIPCYNNGTCVDGIDSWTCQCLQGFRGVHCQTDIDDCIRNPCQHNGTCIDLVDGYQCRCTNDSKGDNCEIRIDHCSSSPCLHDGDCINGIDSYTCQCGDPWHGDRCEFKEVNRTEVCTDLEYSECSCHISTLSPIKRKSYTLISGFTGLLTGLLLTVIYYVGWTLCITDHLNKVEPSENIISGTDLESDNPSIKKIMRTSNQIVEVPRQCECFVDHSGYDHFQRFDKSLKSRFKFHCRHQKNLSSENTSVISSVS